MKKYLIFVVVFAALTIMGCSKKDSLVNTNNGNNVESSETDSLATKQPPYPGWGCFTWYDYDLDTCLLIRHSDVFCGIYIGCNQGVPIAIDTYIDEYGKITAIGIKNYQDLPDGNDAGIEALLEDGWVTILYDTQITDQVLCGLVNEDYIPAGVFPIHVIGNDAVIDITY